MMIHEVFVMLHKEIRSLYKNVDHFVTKHTIYFS